MLKFLKKEDEKGRPLKKSLVLNTELLTTDGNQSQKKALFPRRGSRVKHHPSDFDSPRPSPRPSEKNTDLSSSPDQQSSSYLVVREDIDSGSMTTRERVYKADDFDLNQRPVEPLQTQLQDLTKPQRENLSPIEEQNEGNSEVDQLKKKVKSQQNEIEELQGQVEEEKFKANSLRKERDHLQSDNSSLRSELDSIREQLKRQQELCSTLRAQLDLVTEDEEAMKRMHDRRLRIIGEIEETEVSYLSGLSLVLEHYLVPLRTTVKDLLPETDISIIFNNIEDLHKVASALFGNIRARTASLGNLSSFPFPFADVLLRSLQDQNFGNQYVKYINGCDKAMAVINLHTQVGKKLSGFGQFIKEVQEQPISKKLPLESYLTTPVQRLPRYVLFLKDLAKNTDPSHVDYENVQAALDAATTLASLVNESKRQAEQLERVEIALVSSGKGGKGESLSLAPDPSRKFISEGPIVHLLPNGAQKQRVLILLSDVVLCASKIRDKYEFKWKAHLINCCLQPLEDNSGGKKLHLTEMRKIPTYPFTLNVSFTLLPVAGAQDYEFWKKSFERAFSTFCFDGEKHLLENAGEMKRHMAENLLREKDWAKLLTITEKLVFSKDDIILAEGDQKSCIYKISQGRVRVEKIINNESIVLTTIGKNEFFGEMSYLEKKRNTKRAAASVYADEEETHIWRMEEGHLNNLLSSHPRLAERFFKLLCYILAERFVQRPLENALKKKQGQAPSAPPSTSPSSGPAPNLDTNTNTNTSTNPSKDPPPKPPPLTINLNNDGSEDSVDVSTSPPSLNSLSSTPQEGSLSNLLTPPNETAASLDSPRKTSNNRARFRQLKHTPTRSLSEIRQLQETLNALDPAQLEALANADLADDEFLPAVLAISPPISSSASAQQYSSPGASSIYGSASLEYPSLPAVNRQPSPSNLRTGSSTGVPPSLSSIGKAAQTSMSYSVLPVRCTPSPSSVSPPKRSDSPRSRGHLLKATQQTTQQQTATSSSPNQTLGSVLKRRPSLAPKRAAPNQHQHQHQHQSLGSEPENEADSLETSRKKKKDVLTAQIMKRLKLDADKLAEFPCGLKGRKNSSGTFIITSEAIGYYSQLFGRKTRIVLPFRKLRESQLAPRSEDNLLLIRSSATTSAGFYEFFFANKASRDQAVNLILSRLTDLAGTMDGSHVGSHANLFEEEENGLTSPDRKKSSLGFKLSASDWDELFSCARTRTYHKDEYVLRQDDQQQQLYQIISGSCRVVRTMRTMNQSNKGTYEKGQVVGSVEEGEIFGELSFILGGRATASIVADTQGDLPASTTGGGGAGGSMLALSALPAVKVFSFERAKLETLFSNNPRIASGFYYYLARQIRDRFLKVQNALQMSQSLSS
eukprot:TRINITY_DN562_c1_g2_i1.p1 TRINITY_DN562_c1_g2~~TRINITY_DN562_c1_g2_i1.p1  ORF type:complete len:1369 (-),score=377.92 TRINITY_DN562_c1_g2_i1:93-4199(-)